VKSAHGGAPERCLSIAWSSCEMNTGRLDILKGLSGGLPSWGEESWMLVLQRTDEMEETC
jgi:hypothetical protein